MFDRLGQHLAAVAGVLQEAVDALVAAHGHMGDGVDPQPRHAAAADAAIEQVDLRRDLLEQRIERLVEQFEPGHLGVVQIDDDARALGMIDARLRNAPCKGSGVRPLDPRGRFGDRCVLSTPHGAGS